MLKWSAVKYIFNLMVTPFQQCFRCSVYQLKYWEGAAEYLIPDTGAGDTEVYADL